MGESLEGSFFGFTSSSVISGESSAFPLLKLVILTLFSAASFLGISDLVHDGASFLRSKVSSTKQLQVNLSRKDRLTRIFWEAGWESEDEDQYYKQDEVEGRVPNVNPEEGCVTSKYKECSQCNIDHCEEDIVTYY